MTDTELLGRLRPIKDYELEMMLEWRNAPEVRNSMFNTHIISLNDHLEWWERTKRDDSLQYYLYEYEGIVSGIVYFTDIDKFAHQAKWGFYKSPEAKKGIGTKMLILALELAFSNLKMCKIYGEILGHNTSSLKLHRKLGFENEKIYKNKHLCDDKLLDVYQCEVSKDKWMLIKYNLISNNL